mmetsp:Transcript_7103/g.8233  ORF Transcript_7103/g.8233 Transcript_7103/m.8233 type:complete len:1179 (-) Transcript_7103:398-3934(-)
MSGYLPDSLANWALRGGAGDSNNYNDNDNNNNNTNEGEGTATAPEPAITEADMRARRLARMEAISKRNLEQRKEENQAQDPQPMEVDTDTKLATLATVTTPMEMEMDASPPATKKCKGELIQTATSDITTPTNNNDKVLAKAKSSTPIDSARKIQRKKELLIKKVLNVTIYNRQARDPACLHIDLGPDENENETITDGHGGVGSMGVHMIAELLATRLYLPPSQLRETVPAQKSFILYLATAHRKAAEEAKTLRQQPKDSNIPLIEILNEIQTQVVSYAASGIMEPDLFEQASDSRSQLLRAMIETCGGGDPLRSLTYGVTGKSDSSFYHQLCDELNTQDSSTFENVVAGLATQLTKHLKQCEDINATVIVDFTEKEDATTATNTRNNDRLSCGPTQLVAALQAVCGHKKAALIVTNLPRFLLPSAGSAAANEIIRPPMPAGADIFRMLAGGGGNHRRPYQKRSGVGLEQYTLLGSVFRISTPRDNNPAFSSGNPLRQPSSVIEQITRSQRQQLKVYQVLLNQLVMSFVKAGKDSRNKLFKWFADYQLVNPAATGMRPDYGTKVSSPSLLLNVSIVLLKLCEPFVSDKKKHNLIDPLFVLSADDNFGVFPTQESGNDSLPRLGGDEGDGNDIMAATPYNPKNTFIPQCLFYAARSIALGIAPLLSQHENLLRNISHRNWMVHNSNGDLQSDPQFRMLILRQRSHEVSLFQEEMVVDTLQFCDLMAKILYEMENDDILRNMPEFFVVNVCDILMDVAKFQAKLLRGLQFRYVFKMVVKLLSPKYAHMVRNYNLRAKLGDTLFLLYLPKSKPQSRDIPQSIALDPKKGGQSYLLSDVEAQEALAPSLLLLYGEVEYTGSYDSKKHRAKISSLIKYLWESKEHRPAFQKITQNKDSFIKFANGIINETNQLISTVIEKLPKIKTAQDQMANAVEWGRLAEEEQSDVTSRLEEDEMEVKSALPLCNKTLQMFGYLNTDEVIRGLFLLPELCPRLVNMLIHVLGKLIGSKGLNMKVDNPEQYEFRPKEMLRDLCAIFALFSSEEVFQLECAKSGCDLKMLKNAVKTCQKLNLLTGESIIAFESLPNLVEQASQSVADDEALEVGAPDEFLDEILSTFMKDPVILPSGHSVDRSTITQHLLNDPIDPFNREEMTIDDVKPNVELKTKIDSWLQEKRAARYDEGK